MNPTNNKVGMIIVKGIAKIKTPDGMTLDELKRKMGMNSPKADNTESKDKPDE